SDIVPNTSTDSYEYIAQAAGVNAQSKQLDYQLQMPSYTDGRICCEGAGCSQLNKDYPTCEALRRMPDYEAPNTACTANLPGETNDPSLTCIGTTPVHTRPCPDGACGQETNTYSCNQNTLQWEPGEWVGTCTPKEIKTVTQQRPCPDSQQGIFPMGPRPQETRRCTTIYDCDGNVEREHCTEWDTSACAGEQEEWVWVVPDITNFGYVYSFNLPEHAPWGDLSSGIVFTGTWNLNWVCEHCNRIPEEDRACNSYTGYKTVKWFQCNPPAWHNLWSWQRHAHFACCVKAESIPEWEEVGWHVAYDLDNPHGVENPQNQNCDH
ncbi:MAG: hypothetical protein IKP06_01725, partial [Elusimicrobiaceae bacterium]|nr:hypothetical protein [Elusimicrobiaceae bacterium]